jgi:hypothetical protein
MGQGYGSRLRVKDMGQGYGSRLWVKVMGQGNLSYGSQNQNFKNTLIRKRFQVVVS